MQLSGRLPERTPKHRATIGEIGVGPIGEERSAGGCGKGRRQTGSLGKACMMYAHEIHAQCRAASAPLCRACARCNSPGCRETSVTLPEVSVSAPADRAFFFAPDAASQGAVSRKEIAEQPRSRVCEVLEVVPGLIAT